MNDQDDKPNGERLDAVVLPGADTPITLDVGPGAIVTMTNEQSEAGSMRLDADDEGIIRFHLTVDSPTDPPLEFRLEVKHPDGSSSERVLTVTADPRHVPELRRATPRPTYEERPDPLELDDRALVELGYPPRPDREASPAAFARWLRLVSTDFERVGDRLVQHEDTRFQLLEDPALVMSPTLPLPPPQGDRLPREAYVLPEVAELAFANGTFSNWSGAYLTNPSGAFYAIQAEWNVPRVYPKDGGPAYSAAAEWIGFDNSAKDLYQSGSDSELWQGNWFGMSWSVTRYWMWIEMLPYAPWAVTNFPLSPGDHVSVNMFVADSRGQTRFSNGNNGDLTPANDSIWYMLHNYTTRKSYWGTHPRAGHFTGRTAEFIIERPSKGGSSVALADFCMASMRDCSFSDSWSGTGWMYPLELNDGTQPNTCNLGYFNMAAGSPLHPLATALALKDPSSYGGVRLLWVYNAPN